MKLDPILEIVEKAKSMSSVVFTPAYHFLRSVTNQSDTPRIRWKSAWISTLIALVLPSSIFAKNVPETLRNDQIEKIYAVINKLAETNEGIKRQGLIADYIERIKLDRAKEYDGAIIRVESLRRTASLGTRVNFSTERKPLKFFIEPPFKGLEIQEFAEVPEVERHRGAPNRVEKHKSVANKETGVVNFSLTLVEPNLSEKDVHVTYWGWVDYKYSSAAAQMAAEQDVKPFKDFAEDRLARATSADQEALERAAFEAEQKALQQRQSEKTSKNGNVDNDGGNSALHNYLVGILTGFVCPLILWLITRRFPSHRCNK